MFRRSSEDDNEFPVQSVNRNFGVSAIPASQQAQPAQTGFFSEPEQAKVQPPSNPSAPEAPRQEAPKQYEVPKFEGPKPEVSQEQAVTNNPKESTLKTVPANQPAKAAAQAPAAQPQVSANNAFASSVAKNGQPAQASSASAPSAPSVSFKSPTSSASSSSAGGANSFSVETERRLTVGYGISLEGKVSNCDKLVIYGNVNAELNNVKALQISESGHFRGAAEVEQAEISGTFEGDLRVRRNILINSSGRVNGKITYGSIEIKPGGKFTGEIVEDTETEENAESEAPAAQELDIFAETGVDKAA